MLDTDEWTSADTAAVLRVPTDSDDKYSRGVLGVRTGSDAYPGAAVLGVEAAWRTGVGMVRYLGGDRPTDLVLQRRPETVTVDGRVQAWLIGSGTDPGLRSRAETEALRGILTADEPVIVDAGALDLAPEATAPIIVTPHAREHARLRDLLGLGAESDAVAAVQETAAALGGVVLRKGAVTIVAAPSGWVRAVRADTAWLATAGTGDVLAGALGALVAGAAARGPVPADDLAALAASAAWLHARAAWLASRARVDGPVTALDVADALAAAVGGVLSGGRGRVPS